MDDHERITRDLLAENRNPEHYDIDGIARELRAITGARPLDTATDEAWTFAKARNRVTLDDETAALVARMDGDDLTLPEDQAIVTMALPNTPVAVEGHSFEDALTRFVHDLREYADDWTASPQLQKATNHRDNARLVQAITDINDDELRQRVCRAIGYQSSTIR